MECVFCKKIFQNNSSLTNHKKTAKYCLKIQGNEKDSLEYKCSCDKVFYVKGHLITHEKTCNVKNYALIIKEKDKLLEEIVKEKEDKDKIIKELINEKDKLKEIIQEKIIEITLLTGKISIYKEDHNAFLDIAKQPKITTGNTNNKILNIAGHLDFNDLEKIKNTLENFDVNYFLDGQKGFAKFAVENILKDVNTGENLYICTDPSRNIFKFKDQLGEIQKDVEAKKLTKYMVDGGIKKKVCEITHNLLSRDSDFAKSTDMLFEKNIEMSNFENDNAIFKKELSSLTGF